MSFTDRSSRAAERGTHLRLVHDHSPIGSGRGAPSGARHRIEIVPLPEPRAEAIIKPLAPPVQPSDRRQPESQNTSGAHARLHCHGCGSEARIDLVDLSTRRVHLSCDRCYRMWQEQIRAGDPARRTGPR